MIDLLIGMLIGFAVAAPIGPIGVLCIHKTLQYGWSGTLAVSLGTALADTFYASVAAFGLLTFSDFLLAQNDYFKIFSGILLFSLAFREFYAKNNFKNKISPSSGSLIALFINALVITLCNPIGIVSFIGLFALFGEGLHDHYAAQFTVLGVFIASFFWFVMLGQVTAHFEKYLPQAFIGNVRKISAVILATFGSWAFLSLLWS